VFGVCKLELVTETAALKRFATLVVIVMYAALATADESTGPRQSKGKRGPHDLAMHLKSLVPLEMRHAFRMWGASDAQLGGPLTGTASEMIKTVHKTQLSHVLALVDDVRTLAVVSA